VRCRGNQALLFLRIPCLIQAHPWLIPSTMEPGYERLDSEYFPAISICTTHCHLAASPQDHACDHHNHNKMGNLLKDEGRGTLQKAYAWIRCTLLVLPA